MQNHGGVSIGQAQCHENSFLIARTPMKKFCGIQHAVHRMQRQNSSENLTIAAQNALAISWTIVVSQGCQSLPVLESDDILMGQSCPEMLLLGLSELCWRLHTPALRAAALRKLEKHQAAHRCRRMPLAAHHPV